MRSIKFLIAPIFAAITTSALAADITVATHLGNIPFEYEDQDGTTKGYEVDIVNEVARRLGKTVEYASMPFPMMFPSVQSGRADLAIGTVTITPKRLESVSFSQPWIDSNQCLSVQTNSGIDTLDGLKGKTVATMTGSVGEIWVTANQSKYGIQDLRHYDGHPEAFLDLAAGRVQGIIHDCPTDAYYIKDKPQLKIVTQVSTPERFGAIFNKNSKLIDEFNSEITKLKEEGEIDRIHKKWFGVSAAQDSSTVKPMPIPTL
ncbi:ABC transporter substrate-binding protein [Pseudomonas baetica]|uniref:ABC transporter substrate-binding protein n=1 Tax=Pseudomonas baetica TaxID=674054 RepID=UPI003EEDA226